MSRLYRLYKELAEIKVKRMTIFMNAGFSNSQRGENMITSVRRIVIKAKKATP